MNREHLARLYRFTLALTGSVSAAQSAAERILRRALTGQPGRAVEFEQEAVEPLLELACVEMAPDLQAGTLPVRVQADVIPTGFDLQVYQIADGLGRLPPGHAALLALHFFGGFDLPAAAVVLGVSPGRAERASMAGFRAWLTYTQPSASQHGLAGESALAEDLFRFAESIQPPEAWVTELEKRLRAELPALRAAPPLPAGKDWRKAFKLPADSGGLSLGRRAAGLIVIVGLIALLGISLELTPREGLLIRRRAPTTEPTPSFVRARAFAEQLQGTWVPPAATFCEVWRLRVEAAVGETAQAAPLSPLSQIPGGGDDLGWGCRVTASIPADSAHSARSVQDQMVDWIIADGYIQDAEPNRFIHPGKLARLMVSGPADCPEDADCAGEQVIVTLEAAENRLDQRIEGLFALWQKGDAQAGANLYLTRALVRRYPNSAALDEAVGISRTLGRKPRFTWRMLENAGSFARIEVTARGLLERDTFQMIWALEQDEWIAADLAAETLLPPTDDRLIAADPDGRVVLVDLNSGEQRSLTPPQVYSAAALNSGPRPVISPDGAWLAVSSSTQQNVTYLSALDVPRVIKINHKSSLLAWSPDGQTLALVAANRKNQIAQYDLRSNVISYGCQQTGEISSLAWSPDGTQIALAVFIADPQALPGQSSLEELLQIKLVTADCREQTGLHTLDTHAGDIRVTPYDLSWSGDNRELWYRDELSIRIQERSVRRLFRLDTSRESQFDQWAALFNDVLYQYPASAGTLTSYAPNGLFSARARAGNGTGSPRLDVEILGPDARVLLRQNTPAGLGRLAWTWDSASLILSENASQPAHVWRMNPYSGGIVEISDQLGVIGLFSELQSVSVRRIVGQRRVQADSPVQPADAAPWPVYTNAQSGFSVQIPPNWKVIESRPGMDFPWVVVTNLQVSDFSYPVRLEEEDFALMIYSQPWEPGQGQAEFIAQYREQMDDTTDDVSIVEVEVAGRVGYLVQPDDEILASERPYSRGFFLPTEEKIYSFTIFPSDTQLLDWLDQILVSLQFLDDAPALAARPLPPNKAALAEQVRAAGEPVVVETAIADRAEDYQAELVLWECVVLPDGESYTYQELRLASPFVQQTILLDRRLAACGDETDSRLGAVNFSPTGGMLSYTVTTPPGAGGCIPASTALFSVYRPADGWATLREPPRLLGEEPAWQENGGRIALWQGPRLALLNLEGAVQIRYPAGEPDWQPGPIHWSPDGENIAYLRTQPGCTAAGAAYLQPLDHPVPDRMGDNVTALEWLDEHHIRLSELDGAVREFVTWEGADLLPAPAASATPDPTPALPNPTAIYEAIQTGLDEEEIQTFPAPNAQWEAEVTYQDCRVLEPLTEPRYYSRLRIMDSSGQPVMDVHEDLGSCGLGLPSLQPLAWSPDSRYFYYLVAQTPDGGGCITDTFTTTLRVDPQSQTLVPLPGSGPISPDGSTLAWRDEADLVLWSLDSSEPRRLLNIFDQRVTLGLAWLPDSSALLAIQNPTGCFPLGASSVDIIRVGSGEVETIYEPENEDGPALTSYLGERGGMLYFQDLTQQAWQLDPATGQLELSAWPPPAGTPQP